ncbi:MAG: hypothetical protein RLZZ176_225 [Cyanobacteriota bacterium]|jgi:hypothetical protein
MLISTAWRNLYIHIELIAPKNCTIIIVGKTYKSSLLLQTTSSPASSAHILDVFCHTNVSIMGSFSNHLNLVFQEQFSAPWPSTTLFRIL